MVIVRMSAAPGGPAAPRPSPRVGWFLEDTTMIERILLPLDGSPLAEHALPYALRLASATGARLILMHAAVPPVTPSAPRFDVEAFARQLRGGQVVVPFTSSQGI